MPERTCSVDTCPKVATRREWCNVHYRRWLKHGDPSVVKKAPNGTYHGCEVDGCDRPHHAHGWCAVHVGRARYHGDPLAGGPERIIGDRVARFHSHVAAAGEDECWHWIGSVTPNGYGQFFDDGSLVAAHRVALELATGERPSDELDVDHTCHNGDMNCPGGHKCLHRRCCNPSHLEAVTHAVNVRRGHRFARTGPGMAA